MYHVVTFFCVWPKFHKSGYCSLCQIIPAHIRSTRCKLTLAHTSQFLSIQRRSNKWHQRINVRNSMHGFVKTVKHKYSVQFSVQFYFYILKRTTTDCIKTYRWSNPPSWACTRWRWKEGINPWQNQTEEGWPSSSTRGCEDRKEGSL